MKYVGREESVLLMTQLFHHLRDTTFSKPSLHPFYDGSPHYSSFFFYIRNKVNPMAIPNIA